MINQYIQDQALRFHKLLVKSKHNVGSRTFQDLETRHNPLLSFVQTLEESFVPQR
jgi:hypothetical protein